MEPPSRPPPDRAPLLGAEPAAGRSRARPSEVSLRASLTVSFRALVAVAAMTAACSPERPAESPWRPDRYLPSIVWTDGNDPRLRVEGRARRTSEGPEFAWPASTVHLRFRGRTLDLRLRDTLLDDRIRDHDLVGVFVDGALVRRLRLREGDGQYRVAMRLPEREHVVSLVKLTEPEAGAVTLLGVGTDGPLEAAPPPRPHRILAIGDSITAGYGVAGPAGCHYSAEFADASRAWVTRAAQLMDAEVHVVAWSGRGVVLNNSTEAEELMPSLMERTLPGDSDSTWDWRSFVPEAVVVNLGTNDVSRPEFDLATFERGYSALLDRLRSLYPRARLVVALGPLISDDVPVPGTGSLIQMRSSLQGIVSARQQQGDGNIRFLELYSGDPAVEGFGCDQHPSALTHRRLAGVLANALSDIAPAPTPSVASRGAFE